MKFFNFHLMPYRARRSRRHREERLRLGHLLQQPLRSEEGRRALSRVSRPDGVRRPARLRRRLPQRAPPDRLRHDADPGVLAGALARSAKRAKIAILGRALPLLNNPLMVAEEYAMLDNLTRGRFIAGFVRGIGAEYHAMGINPAISQERFAEAHDLIIRAWTEPGPFAYEGKHYHFNYVNPWPRPYQTPHPPIWIPSQGSTRDHQVGGA